MGHATCKDEVSARLQEAGATSEDLTYACVVSCLRANHGNTLPLLEVLRACETEQPYRDLEEHIDALPIMHMSHQRAHALWKMLVDAGGLESIAVPEPPREEGEPLPDMPEDCRLVITPAGRRALVDFAPTQRFSELLSEEPEGYALAYRQALLICEDGASRSAIESALASLACLSGPVSIYPGYFISKLESVGGIAWEQSAWHTTEAGRDMIALCADTCPAASAR